MDRWNVTWAILSMKLCQQLPPTALPVLQKAFIMYGSSTISELLHSLSGRGFFTGTNYKANCEKFAQCLVGYEHIPAVKEFFSYFPVKETPIEDLINNAVYGKTN